MPARLILLRDEQEEESVALAPGTVLKIGRSPDADLQIRERFISSHHADVIVEGQRVFIEQRSATNSTTVNGVPVSDRRELADGDEIVLALHVHLRFELVRDVATTVPELRVRPVPPAASPLAETVVSARGPIDYRGSLGDRYDIVIVGGGPAGIAAGIQAARRGVSHVVLERASFANTIDRYQKGKWVMDEPPRLPLQAELSMPFVAATREDVLSGWQNAAREAGAHLRIGPDSEVSSIEGTRGDFRIALKGGHTIAADSVVLSIGVQGNLRTFGVPGDELPHVAYQLDDASEHEGKRVVVVGVGDAGIENALALAESGNEVAVVNRRDDFVRAKQANRQRIEAAIRSGQIAHHPFAKVQRFEPGKVVLETNDGEVTLPAELVIGRLGAMPPRRFLEDLGIEFPSDDPNAVPELSDYYESNVAGIYLIGALAGYPLIKNCMNQGFEVIEHVMGRPVTPADEPVLRERFAPLGGRVSRVLERIQQGVPLLGALTRVQLREFLFDSEIVSFEPGEKIYARNEFTDDVFAVLEGYATADTPDFLGAGSVLRAVTMEVRPLRMRYGPGAFFGEESLISGRPRGDSVTAEERLIAVKAPRAAMLRLIGSVQQARRLVDQASVERTLRRFATDATAEEIARLADAVELRTYAPGETLFEEGSQADGLHLIRRGAIAIWRTSGGRALMSEFIQSGNTAGEGALLRDDLTHGTTAKATLLTESIFIPAEHFAALVVAHPDIKDRLIVSIQKERMAHARDQASPAQGGTVVFMVAEGLSEATDFLLIDEALCIGCDNCEKACAATHHGVSRLDREAGPSHVSSNGAILHVPTACRHCENPKCMEDCPPDALRRDPFGEVYIQDNCIGCGNCVSNCPYGVIQMEAVVKHRPRGVLWSLLFGEGGGSGEDDGRMDKKAVKCDLCRELPANKHLDTQTASHAAACVAACPTGAILRVDPAAYLRERRSQ